MKQRTGHKKCAGCANRLPYKAANRYCTWLCYARDANRRGLVARKYSAEELRSFADKDAGRRSAVREKGR